VHQLTRDNFYFSFTSVRWDEEKLKQSEAEKAAFAHVHIAEPKTPFVSGHDTDAECNGCEAFVLKGPRRVSLDGSTTGGESTDTSFHGQEDPAEWHDIADVEEAENETEAEAEGNERHDQFVRLRTEHYHMREALQRAHELLSTDNDD
jgi:hypothetical protein